MENIISTTLHTLVYHTRYSGAHVIHKENVAEHSYYVTLLADLIAHDLEQKMNDGTKLNRLKILQMALYHDTEEAYTGDLITPVKNKSPELKREWDKLSSLMMKEGLLHDFPGQQHIVKYIVSIHHMYETNKTTLLENQIVKFADGLQSIVYLLREIGFGNRHVTSILQNVVSSMKCLFEHNEYLKGYMNEMEMLVQKTLTTGEVAVSAIQKV